MCKNNTLNTANGGGSGQTPGGASCTCKHAGTGGCSSAQRFLAQQHEKPLGMVHFVDPAFVQVGLPGGKTAFDRTEVA